MQIFYDNDPTKPITIRNYCCMLAQIRCSYDSKSSMTKIIQRTWKINAFLTHIPKEQLN